MKSKTNLSYFGLGRLKRKTSFNNNYIVDVTRNFNLEKYTFKLACCVNMFIHYPANYGRIQEKWGLSRVGTTMHETNFVDFKSSFCRSWWITPCNDQVRRELSFGTIRAGQRVIHNQVCNSKFFAVEGSWNWNN